MMPRCLLCNELLDPPMAAFTVALQEDPDAVCTTCRSLPADQRAVLREQAIARLTRLQVEPES